MKNRTIDTLKYKDKDKDALVQWIN